MDIPFLKEVVLGLIAVIAFAVSCYKYGRKAGNKRDKTEIARLRTNLADMNFERQRLDSRLMNLETVVKDAQDFWLRPPDQTILAAHQAALSSSMPVICVVNLKGGVGKTTITANLAAYFAETGKRVLMIDTDYQGSLSDTVLAHARVDEFRAVAHQLIESGHDYARMRNAAERLSSIDSRMWIYPAFYGFNKAEIQMMFRWLVGQDDEIRFNLSNYLQSPPFKQLEESRFDIVLIDAPPRMLTGVVNALTASTHVLVPTILDGQSHIATLNTLSAIQQFKYKLNPQLRVLGIVPSMVSSQTGYNGRELQFLEELENQIPHHYNGPLPILKNRPIWRREELAKSGGQEIYFSRNANTQQTRDIRAMFKNLGKFVEENVEWRRREAAAGTIAMPGLRKRSGAE